LPQRGFWFYPKSPKERVVGWECLKSNAKFLMDFLVEKREEQKRYSLINSAFAVFTDGSARDIP